MFDWLDYLALARELAARQDAASRRAAISRAYYAAFHIAKAHVENAYPEVSVTADRSVHLHVWSTLESGKSPAERAAAHSGRRLQRRRTQADYDVTGLSFPRDVSQSLSEADAVIHALGRSRPPARS